MPPLIRGALIEYGSDFLGPIPNVVIFQFNPETLSRNIQIPQKPSGSSARETTQAGEIPIEKISFVAKFSAADQLNTNNPLARLYGIGPRLAALEKMVRPAGKISGLIGEAIDAVGDAVFGGGNKHPTQPIPRESFPRILFVWGAWKALPVVIESMGIEEKQFDNMLNPVEAEVSIGLLVNALDPCSEDRVAKGAMLWSNLAKDTQAVLNLANTAEQVADIIPF
jgi:hypothetical protein